MLSEERFAAGWKKAKTNAHLWLHSHGNVLRRLWHVDRIIRRRAAHGSPFEDGMLVQLAHALRVVACMQASFICSMLSLRGGVGQATERIVPFVHVNNLEKRHAFRNCDEHELVKVLHSAHPAVAPWS